ncbi:MAG: hypothetical protein Q7U51_03015 [Methanoregula sp.]|nr:hypothetical protein [Methanoregula sp.]
MTQNRSVKENSVPLYLLPMEIANRINQMGDSVYRISVKRTKQHHYNISVRVRALPKELTPACSCIVYVPDGRPAGDDTGHNPPCGKCEA